jgi:hypothetical protein
MKTESAYARKDTRTIRTDTRSDHPRTIHEFRSRDIFVEHSRGTR